VRVWIVDSGWQREGAYNRLRLRRAEAAGARTHSATSWAVEATSDKRQAASGARLWLWLWLWLWLCTSAPSASGPVCAGSARSRHLPSTVRRHRDQNPAYVAV
jgi:hypothetical protein